MTDFCRFTFDRFRALVKDLASQFKKDEGRYYVLLSLEEAEHFRGFLHGRHGETLVPTEAGTGKNEGLREGEKHTTAALWVVADAAAFLLTDSFGFAAAPPAQHAAMVNSYRYLNSDEHFDDQGIIVLLRLLQANTCEEREKWWTEIRACRRRRQFACDATVPVHTVFTAANEYQFMEHKAVVNRIRWALRDRGLLVFDAFRAFNSSNTGLLTCSELYGGLDFLGIPFQPEQVYDLVRKVATYVDGLISYVEFRRAFQLSDEELESRAGGDATASTVSAATTIESVPPKNIPEIAEQLSEQQQQQQVPVTEALLQNFSVKIRPVPSFTLVWNSEDTQSHSQVSVWAPTVRVVRFVAQRPPRHRRLSPVFPFAL